MGEASSLFHGALFKKFVDSCSESPLKNEEFINDPFNFPSSITPILNHYLNLLYIILEQNEFLPIKYVSLIVLDGLKTISSEDWVELYQLRLIIEFCFNFSPRGFLKIFDGEVKFVLGLFNISIESKNLPPFSLEMQEKIENARANLENAIEIFRAEGLENPNFTFHLRNALGIFFGITSKHNFDCFVQLNPIN